MLFRIAFLSLWQHRRRTGVLMTAIGLVTALMIFLLVHRPHALSTTSQG
jgi:hypothetical protein